MNRTISLRPIELNKQNEKTLSESIFKYTPPDFMKKSKFKIG